MPEAKTAILTGGSGFLGSHFIKGLSKNHHSIYVLDTKPLDKKLIAEFSNLDLEYFNVNVSEEDEVVNFFESIKDRDILLTTLINAQLAIQQYHLMEWKIVQNLKILKSKILRNPFRDLF